MNSARNGYRHSIECLKEGNIHDENCDTRSSDYDGEIDTHTHIHHGKLTDENIANMVIELDSSENIYTTEELRHSIIANSEMHPECSYNEIKGMVVQEMEQFDRSKNRN